MGKKPNNFDKYNDLHKGASSPKWKGCGEISGNHWNKILRRYKNENDKFKKSEFNISLEYIWNLFLEQERKCALSGLILEFKPTKRSKIRTTASLDRIDSNKGYIIGNIQWVHTDINIMKNKFEQNYFLTMCKLISNNGEKINR